MLMTYVSMIIIQLPINMLKKEILKTLNKTIFLSIDYV